VFDPGGGTAVGADFPHHAVRAGGVWPNPTNGQSRFAFDLPAASNVSMDIFDVRGRLVRTLDGGEFGEGRNHIVWDGRNALGTDLPAGVYLARFNVGGRQLPGGSVTLVR
jgi:flagellar hook assembly protein FlgD